MLKRRSSIIATASLLAILTAGLILRILNFSKYILYPDGYVNLILGERILALKTTVISLGSYGDQFPVFYHWTRPLTPFVLGGISGLFSVDSLQASRIVNIAAYVVAAGLVFVLGRWLFVSNRYASIAALAFSVSATEAIWAGFPLTEPLAAVCVLLVMTTMIKLDPTKHSSQMILGFALGSAVLCRYEYALLIVPVAVYMALTYGKKAATSALVRAYSVASVFVVVCLLIVVRPYIYDTLQLGGALVCLFGIALFAINIKLPSRMWSRVLCGGITILYIVLSSGLRSFILAELPLVIVATVGVFKWGQLSKRPVVPFTMISFLLFGCVFVVFSSTNMRYWTLFVPMLALLAPAGVVGIVEYCKRRIVYVPIIALLLIVQLILCGDGIRYWSDGVYRQMAYEQIAAKRLRPYIGDNAILITAEPEPYYYETRSSLLYASNEKQYVSAEHLKSLSDKEVVIVQDAGMHVLYPSFSEWLTVNLSKYKVGTFEVDQPFLYDSALYRQYHRVVIYKIPADDLAARLSR